MAPKVANNATDACPVTSVSAAEKLNPNTLWQRYSEGKQSAAQLAAQYGCSIKTIRRYLIKAATQGECALPQAPVNPNGHHLFRPPVGRHDPLRRPQQARFDGRGS